MIPNKVIKSLLPVLLELESQLTYPENKRKPHISSKTKFLAIAFSILWGYSTFRSIMLNLVVKETKKYFPGETIPRSQSTLADFSENLNSMEIRRFINISFKQSWRKKRFLHFALSGNKYVIAIDGVETQHSKKTCCGDCLKRVHKKGAPEEWVEYYHREVVAVMVGRPGAYFIDSEPISAKYNETGKDDETGAARRLLTRLKENKTLKYFDIVVVDALYAKAPFILLTESYGLIPVIRIKQENYRIIQDIKGLAGLIPFSKIKVDIDRNLEYQIREFNNLTSWESYPKELRIVEIKGKHLKKDKKNEKYHAYWVLPQKTPSFLSMDLIRVIGHWRWKEELNEFRSLKQNYKIQHIMHHHPVSIQVIFLLKSFLHSISNLHLIRKVNPFTKQHYFLKDLLNLLKTHILMVKASFIKEIYNSS
jgi:hypothetical protein